MAHDKNEEGSSKRRRSFVIRCCIWVSLTIVLLAGWLWTQTVLNQTQVTGSESLLEGPHFRGFPLFSPDQSNAPESVLGNGSQVPVECLIRTLSAEPAIANRSLAQVEAEWSESYVPMLVELARFASEETRQKLLQLVSRKTNAKLEGDFNDWHQWSCQQGYRLHPDYARFKALLYEMVDSRFTDFFQATDSATIRLDQIQWGSVTVDGIPPLKKPEMLPSGQASYLDDSNVVFGVEVNGDFRCYPKRILAWHEMFEDTIGGTPVCGVY